MTPQQQTDLKTWLKDTSQELPESLENVLIEDCIEELKNSEETRCLFRLANDDLGVSYDADDAEDPFSELGLLTFSYVTEIGDGYSGFGLSNVWGKLPDIIKIAVILTLLSRTPNGEAVIPFLDVPIRSKTIEEFKTQEEFSSYIRYEVEKFTLGHLLYREFTEALRLGKGFEAALKEITKIYLINVYGTK